MIIGTTGLMKVKAINCAAQLFLLSLLLNFSVGVNLVLKLLEKAAKVMGSYSDIEIVEFTIVIRLMHHLVRP